MSKTDLIIPIYSGQTKASAKAKLPSVIFKVNASDQLLTQYTYVYLSNQKRNVSRVKSRGMVQGSTRKIYRQKGTGRARHGDRQAPIFVGGGIAHGPKGQQKKLTMTKKMKRKALFYTLSLKAKNQKIIILADTQIKKVAKTKQASILLKKLFKPAEHKTKSVFVFDHQSEIKRHFYNIENLTVLEPCSLNAYKIMQHQYVIFTEKALAEFISLFTKEKK